MKIGSQRICHSPEFKKLVSGSLTPELMFLTLLYVGFPSSLDEMTVRQEWWHGKAKKWPKHTCINRWFTGSLVMKQREKLEHHLDLNKWRLGVYSLLMKRAGLKVKDTERFQIYYIRSDQKTSWVEMSRKKKKTCHFRGQKISTG